MTRYKSLLQRTLIGSMVALQVLFYPSLSFATTPSDPDDTPVVSSAVSDADPQTVSESAPEASADTATATDVTMSDPGLESETSSTATNTTDTTTTTTTNADVTNTIESTAQSGDATASENYGNGTALSGNSTVIANLVNMFQSQSNVIGNGNTYAFSADIYGDVYGDLFVDPAAMNTIQNTDLSNTEIRVVDNGSVTNNVILNALSGDANANDNYENGTATSGSANAVANIVNIMNSIITAGGSFFGNINIHGNLNGDILLPPNLLAQVLATNSIPTTTISIDTDTDLNANLASTTAINNQVTTTANSGTATSSENLGSGVAQTGHSTTNITVLNLTGRSVVGANALLVFVNVQGEWIGVIMDAPAGTTAAMLGDSTATSTNSQQTDITASTTHAITNNVQVNAASGNANANANYENGTATSGNASASANIANMTNSGFSLSSWFGVLFINIFGSWHGSFGVDTAAGGNSTPGNAYTTQPNNAAPQVFQFVAPLSEDSADAPSGSRLHLERVPYSATPNASTGTTQVAATSTATVMPKTAMLSDNTTKASTTLANSQGNSNEEVSSAWNFTLFALGLAALLLLAERIIAYMQRRRI